MDVVNYALTKKMVSSVASGIVEVQTDGTNIRFKTANGDWFSVRLNSVDGATISSNGHLIIELTDGTTLDAGALPVGTMDSSLSTTSENGVQNKVITNALGDLNSLCDTKLSIVASLPITPHNQETVLYVGTSDDGLKSGGIYQYQVSEWVLISNVSSFTFNSDEFAVDSTTNEVSLKPNYADIPSFLPNNVSSSNKLATMDNVAHEVDTSYMSNGVLNILSIRQSLGAGCYEIMGQGNSGHGSIRLNIWQVSNGAFAFSCCITDFSGVRSICNNEGDSTTVDVGTSYFLTTNRIVKIF